MSDKTVRPSVESVEEAVVGAGRWRVALWTGVFALAGVAHFRRAEGFDAIVPPQLPGKARTYTNVSGVMELGLAAGLACPKTRSVAARLAQAFLLGVWPGNIYMAIDWFGKKSPVAQLIALLRVPLQLPMIASVGKLARKR